MFHQFENSLRRHNHVGLVHALLASMAKAGVLNRAQEGAQKVMQERISKAKQKKIDMEYD
jgi:ubiquitin carboxyl-terminal hydrolase L5